jgi:uncharacterized membrane protein (UPF0127 family)
MIGQPLAPRLRGLPVAAVLGREVPMATTFRSRLLGLVHLAREEAGPGLLIPRCSSVHTFGMRFELDVYFLGADNKLLAVRREIPANHLVSHRGAGSVLEIPAGEGGEF